MIGWIVEQDRRNAVLLHEKRVCFQILGQECTIYLQEGSYYLRVPYPLRFIQNPAIEHEAVTIILDPESGNSAEIFWSIYEKGYDCFQRRCWKKQGITIGSSIDDDIYVQDNNLKPHQFHIDIQYHIISDLEKSGHADCSGNRVEYTSFHNGDCFRFINLQILLYDSFFAVSSASNTYCSADKLILPEQKLPPVSAHFVLERQYHQSLHRLCFEEELKEPEHFETLHKRPLIFLIGPALMMSFASLFSGLLAAYNSWLNGRELIEILPIIILPSVMVISALLWNPLQRLYDTRTERFRKKKRLEAYKTYLMELKERIKKIQNTDVELCKTLFPEYIAEKQFLWRSLPGQAEFLRIRLGTGIVPYHISLRSSLKKSLGDPIPELIEDLEKECGAVSIPVLADFSEVSKIAVVYHEQEKNYIHNLFAQFLFYHGPDVIQIGILCSSLFAEQHQVLREIPHLRMANGKRFIVTTVREASEACHSLTENSGKKLFLFCFKPSLLSCFTDMDYTVVYPICNGPVPAEAEVCIQTGKSAYIWDGKRKQQFKMDPADKSLFRAVCSIMNRCEAVHTNVFPDSGVTFFELYHVCSAKGINFQDRWKHSKQEKHLNAYIGIGDDGENAVLDLSEAGQGPHGLIAGMTGSGKSELIITLVLSLCVNYSPQEFQFVMIDFKGGGAASLFSNNSRTIPHCAGILSNIDETIMERALISFQNECMRREKLFSKMADICGKSVMNLDAYQEAWNREYDLPYLSSLLIIIDEFAELKKEQPDVMHDLISVARVGRSLGIHMILATQKPGGIVDDQIWSNCRFKICLKVQDRTDSNEMIHSSDAAYICRPGEAFMMCDGIRSHIQCGYANAPSEGKKRYIEMLDAMSHTVKRESFHIQTGGVQAEDIITELCRSYHASDAGYQLWCAPIEHVTRSDLPDQPGLWLGIIDDYRNRIQKPYRSNDAVMAVFTIERQEKCAFLKTVLRGLLETAEKHDCIFVIDDLHIFDSSIAGCRSICGLLSSREEELTQNLLKKCETEQMKGICTLIITDVSAFSDAKESNRMHLHRIISNAEQNHIRLILCYTTISSVPYRDLALIPIRIALKNESLQDLSAIFEQHITHPVVHPNTALISSPDPVDLCILETSDEELEEEICRVNQKYGTEKPYVLPQMPKQISFTSCPIDGIPLGMDLLTYEWITVSNSCTLIILATYEEELYAYYELMKQHVSTALLLPKEKIAEELMKPDSGTWIFLTLEQYQLLGLKHTSFPILYIGTGFQEQYRFTSRWKKELKENQGIFFRTGKNRVLQLTEVN